MQDVIVAGDTVDFLTSVPDFPPSAGYTLKFRLVPLAGGTAIEWTAATGDDDQYRTQVGPAITAPYAADDYNWFSWVEKSGARYSVGQGTCRIKPDPAVLTTAYDGRSHPARVLAAIEAVLEKRATMDQESYSIGGRTLARMSVGDLMRFRQRYAAEVAAEDAAARLALGLGGGRKIQVRL